MGLRKEDLPIEYYKVVTEVDDVLGSAWVLDKANVEYIRGIWVSAPSWLAREGYHLFVFDDVNFAEVFADRICDHDRGKVVYRCEVQGVYSQLPQFLDNLSLWRGEIEISYRESFPSGTVMVQKVKLLEEVES